jgi:hypothetical protein
MASSASLPRALAGLLQNVQLLLGEAETAELLPQASWLPDQEAKAAATWATTIATLGLNYQPHILSQHSQRLTIFSHLYEGCAAC